MRSAFSLLIITLLLILLRSSTSLFGQDLTEAQDVNTIQRSKYYLGLTPTAFINSRSGIQISQEYYLNKHWSTSAELGYLFMGLAVNNMLKSVNGLRFRPSINYNFHITEKRDFQLGLFYNLKWYLEEREADVIKGGGNYRELIRGTREVLFQGGGISMSMVIFDPNIRHKVGIGAGLGGVVNKYENEFIRPRWSFFRIFPSDTNLVGHPIFFLHWSMAFGLKN